MNGVLPRRHVNRIFQARQTNEYFTLPRSLFSLLADGIIDILSRSLVFLFILPGKFRYRYQSYSTDSLFGLTKKMKLESIRGRFCLTIAIPYIDILYSGILYLINILLFCNTYCNEKIFYNTYWHEYKGNTNRNIEWLVYCQYG